MKLLALLIFVFADTALAATDFYDVEMKVSVNGGKSSFSPSMFLVPGEPSSAANQVDGEETFVEVVAKEGQIQNRKGILMNLKIGKVSADGKRTILSNAQVLTEENKVAEVRVGKQGAEDVVVSVVAQRKAL